MEDDRDTRQVRPQRWITETVFGPTFLLVLVFLVASASAAYLLSVEVSQTARTHDLATAARAQSELLSAVRSFYTREVVEKIYASRDVTVSHDFSGQELTIPAPVTMTLALEQELAARGSESGIRMVSEYPFSWRTGRDLDDFEMTALRALADDPSKPFQRLEQTPKGEVFRSAIAVVMDQTCVTCHNSHPDSPRDDWKVGDVRGIQEVVIPADAAHFDHFASLDNVFAFMGVAFSSALGLSLLLSRQRKRAVEAVADLAAREREKSSSLAKAVARAEAGEAQVAAIIDTMVDGLITVGPDGCIQTANPAALILFAAASMDAVRGRALADFIPDLHDDDFHHHADEVEAKPQRRRDVIVHRADGRTFHAEVAVSGVALAGTSAFTVILRDLTDQKAAAEKLKKAETRLVDAIESLPDGFVLYDADDRLVLCNSKYREFYATSSDLIQIGERFEDIIRKGAARGQYNATREGFEEWVAMRMAHHNNPGEPMEQLLDDGRWLRVIESRTSEGGLVGFRVDITELKEREEDLRQSQDLLRNVVDASFDGVIVMDGEGCVVEYSPSAADVFGWTPEEIAGKRMSDFLIPQRYRQMHDDGLKRFLETGEGPVVGKRIEIEGLHKDGHEVILELAIRHTEGQSGPLFLGYVRDITERKAADDALRDAKEKAEIANEAKAKFLAMMSHEIRTPLNGVLGVLSLLRDTPLNTDQHLYVRTARESGRALMELINDILDFTKLEAGRMELDVAPFRLPTLLQSVVDLFTPIAREKAITLTLDYPTDVPASVVADAGRIRQVVLNLISNAVKFTEVGSVKIQVDVSSSDTDRAIFSISVIDTGIGIPSEKHDVLFGDFVTVDSGYTRTAGGSGLGLAISRQLTDLMGGEITFDSVLGAGSTFRVMLPLPLAADDALPKSAREDAVSLPAGLRILLAEDNATNQIVVAHALERFGCDVDIAQDGVDAVKYAKGRDYDVILMDVSMPQMDGLEATERIRAMARHTTTPIIALTAYALRGDRERFLTSGMDDFLSKPVEKADLVAMLARHVSPHQRKGREKHQTGHEAATVSDGLEAAHAILESMPPELQHKLIQQVIADTQTRCASAKAASDTGDVEGLERATHALKSVAGTFGATELATLASHINELIRNDKPVAAFERVDDLLQAGEATVVAVEALANRIAGSADVARDN